jgi:hypothetical protein
MSSVLSAADILDLRAAVSELFPDRAAIHRRTEASSEYGGDSSPYAVVAGLGNVPVLFGLRSQRQLSELALGAAQVNASNVDQFFTFPGGTDIRGSDRIVTAAPDAKTYEVVSVGGGGSWEVTLPVAARRVS